MTSYRFSRWGPLWRNFTSVSNWVTTWRHFFQNVNVYQHIKYRQSSIHGRDVTISVLQKQTSAILKFFLRFRLWLHHRNPHDILHKVAKLHPYRTTQCRNMTSYRFFQMLDAAAQYYFRFRICWCYCQKVKDYQQTKFRWHISIDGLGITTSVFEKQTSAIVEFYIRFWCQPHRRNLHVVLHQATEFRPNRSTRCENMMSYPFLKISAATAKYCFRFRICWRFWRFGLIFTPLFGKFLGHIFPIWRHPLSWAPKGPVVGGNTSFEPFVDVTAFKRSKSISKPNFVDISQFTAEISPLLVLKNTSAILDFYFLFRSRPFRRNRRVILHPAAEFCQSRNIHCGNMTSYRFSRWRPSAMLYLLWGNGGPPTNLLGPQIASSFDE